MALLPLKRENHSLKNLFWFAPALIFICILMISYHGNFPRYSLGVFVPLILPTAIGVARLRLIPFSTMAYFLVLITFLLPTYKRSTEAGLPDTRTLAKEWIQNNIPSDTKIFVMDPYNCPQLLMSKEQVARLKLKTEQMGHPRAAYYRLLEEYHPSGGYEIYYWKRGFKEVEDLPQRTESSYNSQDTIDLNEKGLEAMDEVGIKTLVVRFDSNVEAPPAWWKEIPLKYTLVEQFAPKNKKIKGPQIDIYQASKK
jgi:hypothetical protein